MVLNGTQSVNETGGDSDSIGSCPPIPSLGAHVAVARSEGIHFVFVLQGMGNEEHDAKLREHRCAEAGTIELEAPQVWTPKTAGKIPTSGSAPVDVPATATASDADEKRDATTPPEPVDPKFF